MAKVVPFRLARREHETAAGVVVGRAEGSYNGPIVSTQVATIIQQGKPFVVGEWLVEPSLNRLTRGGESVQLELRAIDVLLCLVEHAGEVVGKDTLLDTVWRTEFVSDNTLMSRIGQLRAALGDDAQNPRYIETIRKRGYRLIAEVHPVPSSGEASQAIPVSASQPEQEQNPYPGLAAFTEVDADRFFGREAEEAELWRKISARRLVAVIGPSGVGKSSLLRAGVAARAPPGWRVVVFTPGEAPTLSLARALAPDHAGDPAAMARLLGFSDSDTALAVVSRWRGEFDEVVLVVDQFEELFTLNPLEVQASFIELLSRLVDAADVHLVLAMRDDYLYRCQRYPQIAPIFKDLTPLGPPAGEGLRRAIKEPAGRQLYRFESELLVDRMIAEVEGERGALPLMAFAVHRLWEERDREEHLLTEDAYEHIGRVAGALANHADATLERIGFDRLPVVRELFRNLVTSEGTRAIREVDELLSVFPGDQRLSAEDVLRELIDARLLTSYKHDGDGGSLRQVEIIHESLLTSWPRLVRWQTQDADSARLRDELRQAARTWDDHERASDYLWTGKAFTELSVWREDYPGGLTDLEEEFADASTARARGGIRRRRLAAAALLVAATVVALVFGVLWRRSVQEARRAEAAKLLALGQLHLEDYPTATLAHAIASLELTDTAEARQLALRSLWEGPTAIVVSESDTFQAAFARSGDWLVQNLQSQGAEGHLRVVTKNGSGTLLPRIHDSPLVNVDLNPEGTVMYTAPLGGGTETRENAVLWSLPDGRRLNESWFEPSQRVWAWVKGWSWSRNHLVVLVREGDQLHAYALGFDGTTDRLGTIEFSEPAGVGIGSLAMDRNTGRRIAALDGDRVVVIEIAERGLSEPRVLGRHEGKGHRVAFDPDGRSLATASSDGKIRIWDPAGTGPSEEIDGPPNIDHMEVSSVASRLEAYALDEGTLIAWVWLLEDGGARLLRRFECGPKHGFVSNAVTIGWDPSRRLFAKSGPGKTVRLWSLGAPADAEPLVLRRGDVGSSLGHAFHRGSQWLATAQMPGLILWPLSRGYPRIIAVHRDTVYNVTFAPAGEWLASGSEGGMLQLTPLVGEVPEATTFVHESWHIRSLSASPDGKSILVGRQYGGAALFPVDGGPSASLGAMDHVYGVTFSPDGQLAAVSGWGADSKTKLHVFRTDTFEETAVLEPYETVAVLSLDERHGFLPDGRLLSAGLGGLWASDPTTGASELLFEGICTAFASSADGRRIALVARAAEDNRAPSRVVLLDLDAGTETHLANYGNKMFAVAMNAAGTTIVTGDHDGTVRVGSADGADPHLLLGHEGFVVDVDIDPLGRWVASGGEDATVRIWPMPELSKPPLHTLPHDELIAKLKTLTNVRVVRDEESETGWTLTHDPFSGWETVPTW